MRLLLLVGAIALSGCAVFQSPQHALLATQFTAESAFAGFNKAANGAIAAGLPEPYLHTLHVDYDAAHSALLALRAGTGSASAVLGAVTKAGADVPQLAAGVH